MGLLRAIEDGIHWVTLPPVMPTGVILHGTTEIHQERMDLTVRESMTGLVHNKDMPARYDPAPCVPAVIRDRRYFTSQSGNGKPNGRLVVFTRRKRWSKN